LSGFVAISASAFARNGAHFHRAGRTQRDERRDTNRFLFIAYERVAPAEGFQHDGRLG
jgi:hypothetical protein